MGNCISNDKKGKSFGGLAENNKKGVQDRIKTKEGLQIGKEMFIMTNDGKFSEKYSMGQLLG